MIDQTESNSVNILVICRNADIRDTIVRLLTGQGSWRATGVSTDEEALLEFARQSFNLVLIGGGVSEESEERLSQQFRKKDPSVKIIQHYGGGSGLLFGEIHEALNKNS